YAAGFRGGRPFIERFGHLVRVNPEHMAQTEALFARYGVGTVLFGRFLLGLRIWTALMAGMSRMPYWRFQYATAAGALLWAAVICLIGFQLGRNWSLVTRLVDYLGVGGVIVVVVMLVMSVWLVRRRALRIGR
ncbi:MAG: DedA family protein, partial [Candidatus Dormibacteraeota bacterium]|nr:DedA family protein [Candidatus Dormibacteraeota bacterium]